MRQNVIKPQQYLGMFNNTAGRLMTSYHDNVT